MKSHFDQLRAILIKHKAPPLFYAGDIFHKWNAPPELINFLLSEMPTGYAIPGNHDLPYHNYADRKKSAYWTLVKARKLIDMEPGQWVHMEGVSVRAYPFGSVPERCPMKPMYMRPRETPNVRVALIHAYCWKHGHAFPGATEEQHVRQWSLRLQGYDGLIFGDNHQPFTEKPPGRSKWVRNGGAFMRQTTSEMDVQPTVGLIWSDGSLTQEKLDRRGDVFHPPDEFVAADGSDEEMENLLTELAAVGGKRPDFRAALKRAADKSTVPPAVRRLVLDFMGEGK